MTHTRDARPLRSFPLHRWRRLALAIACSVLLMPLVNASAVAATPPLTFNVMLGESCLTGTARLNASLLLVVRDPAGKLLGKGVTTPDLGAYWTFCDFYGALRPGITIKATLYNHRGTITIQTVRIPPLSLRLDRDSDVATGKGPAGQTVVISLSDYRWDPWNEAYGVQQPVSVPATGRFTYDFGADGINVRGGANAMIEWSNAANTVYVYRYAFAPYLNVQLDTPELWGATRLNGHVAVTLRNAGLNVVANGNAVADWWSGAYWGLFSDDDDEIYDLKAGTLLSATGIGSDVDWTVPAGVTSVSKVTDLVAGKCFPNSRYLLGVTDLYGSESAVFGTASADGSLSMDFTSMTDIVRNFSVNLQCWTSSGDGVSDSYKVP